MQRLKDLLMDDAVTLKVQEKILNENITLATM